MLASLWRLWPRRSSRTTPRCAPMRRRATYRPGFEGLEDRTLPATVTTLLDGVAGSLRDAIANTPLGGTVTFAPGLSGTIVLTGGTLALGQSMTITGPGANVIAVSGNNQVQVVNVLAGAIVTVSGLSVLSGQAPNGGGILNAGALTLNGVSVSGNTATGTNSLGGGGIYNAPSGTLVILNSTIANNQATASNASGGGILNGLGSVTIQNSTIANNQAAPGGGGNGGGILNAGGQNAAGLLNIFNTTITGNTAFNGGGLVNTSGTARVVNATIVGNSATGNGGGYFAVGNDTLQNSIVANNPSVGANEADAFGQFVSAVNNLIGQGNSQTNIQNGVNGNQVGTSSSPLNPQVGPLANNGGPTQTMALLAGSPAIDRGLNNGVTATDQRGLNRIVNTIVDIGAYEYQPPATATTVSSTPNPSLANQQVVFTAHVAGVAPGSNTATGTVQFFDNGQSLGDRRALTNGRAQLTVSNLTVGSHHITATYSGDFEFTTSTSAPYTQVVGTSNQLFAAQLFRDFAYREPAGAETSFWSSLLERGLTRADVASLFQAGGEARTHLAANLVRALLGRAPTPEELNQHVAFLASGGSTDQIKLQLLSSEEFYFRRGGGTNGGFLAALFESVLGRKLDPASADLYGLRMARGAVRAAIAFDLITSVEAQARIVQVAYQRFFQRPGDAAGVNHFTRLLAVGALRPEQVHTALVASVGFAQEAGLDANQRYITQLYLDLFRRPVDPSGLTYWSGVLDSGLATPYQVVLQLQTSTEYLTQVVQGLYQQYLRRPADPTGLATFVSALQGGPGRPPATIEQVAASLVGSQEFYVVQGGGTIPGFLNALYLAALGRPVDAQGLQTYGTALSNGTLTTQQVGLLVLSSREYYTDLITADYNRYLRRLPDPVGLANFLSALLQGATDQEVVASIAGSAEYYNNAIAGHYRGRS